MTYEDQEKRLEMFLDVEWQCQACDHDIRDFGVQQLAHIIPAKKRYIKKYGKAIIHHRLNMKPVCSLKCNAAVDINGKDALIERHVAKIRRAIDG